MQSNRKRFTLFTTLLSTLFALLMVAPQGTAAAATYRWDTVSVLPENGAPTTRAGGSDYALAADLTSIQISGHGTFSTDGAPATGGGSWTITRPSGGFVSGTFTVTSLVLFFPAVGSLPPAIVDTIGNKADARSGLAVLRISYSDGGRGTLTVSCHLPVGSPSEIFEGITATKSYIDFNDNVPAVAGINANRTLFHVVH